MPKDIKYVNYYLVVKSNESYTLSKSDMEEVRDSNQLHLDKAVLKS